VNLNNDNFTLHATRLYNNPQCFDQVEFREDLRRFNFIKRSFEKYKKDGSLNERAVLNCIITLYNVFGDSATDLLFFKSQGHHNLLKPFLVFLNRLPYRVFDLYTSDISMDDIIVERLRSL
jgi:hypothetical protein